MLRRSRTSGVPIRGVSILCLLLLIVSSFAATPGLAAQTAAPDRGRSSDVSLPGAAPAAVPGGTYQNFDSPGEGTPYTVEVRDLPPPPTPLDGGPTGEGKLLRLVTANPANDDGNHNSIAFDRTNPGPFDQIVADFDFRLSPQKKRADGLGFALLNTTSYNTSGAAGAMLTPFVAEEPNFLNSLGIGFDIYRSSDLGDINDNHVSVHFNGLRQDEFDVGPVIDLAAGQWIHARIIMRPGGNFGDVTVILTQCGRPPATVVDRLKVPGLVPYEGRAFFAARLAGAKAHHDIDNVHVQFMSLTQNILAFSSGCARVLETAGHVDLTVVRAGDPGSPAMVNYATSGGTADPDDYTATSGTLTFGAGESTKTLRVPILDDATKEGHENFLLTLSEPNGAALGGPAYVNVTIIDDETAREEGYWGDVLPSQVLPIHAHLLPTGKVLYWDRHDEKQGWEGRPQLWDPATEMIAATTVPTLTYDIFCAGHSFLEDGRLLVTGGHITDGEGEDEASIYNPFTKTWQRLPAMNKGRWYPSNVTLPNGDVLVVGGSFISPTEGLNKISQVWSTGTGTWRDLNGAPLQYRPAYANYYPFLYVAPNGKVFVAGPQQVARYLDTSGAGAWTDVATSTLIYREYGSSVMYDSNVLIIGGNQPDPNQDAPTIVPSASAEVINLNDNPPVWKQVQDMHSRRRQLNATLLPDGKVLVTGGSSVPGFDNSQGAVLRAELWDPATELWTPMAAQSRYRGYHSTALLLPDGRVLSGGGGHPDSFAGAQYNFEIYSPPYLFKGPRPTIASAPDQVAYDRPFVVRTPDASNILTATLIRLPSVTHSFDQNQRLVHLPHTVITDGLGINITTPFTSTLAPPGHYMLFLVNKDGVPSVARIIQLGLTVAADDSYGTGRDMVLRAGTARIPGVLSNDNDLRSNVNPTLALVTGPAHGVLNFPGNGSFVYTPAPGYTGPDKFVYRMTSSSVGGITDTATVNITVRGVYLALIRR